MSIIAFGRCCSLLVQRKQDLRSAIFSQSTRSRWIHTGLVATWIGTGNGEAEAAITTAEVAGPSGAMTATAVTAPVAVREAETAETGMIGEAGTAEIGTGLEAGREGKT